MKDSLHAFINAIETSPLIVYSVQCGTVPGFCVCLSLQRLQTEIKHKINELMLTERDVHFVQQKITVLHQSLTSIANRIYANTQHTTLRFNAFQAIEDLLQHAYINNPTVLQDKSLPHFMINRQGAHMQERYSKLQRKLKKNEVDIVLLDTLEQFFKQYNSKKMPGASHSQLAYAEKVLRGIDNLLLNESHADWPDKIWKTLIHLNLNRERLMNCALQNIHATANSGEPVHIIRQQLEEYLKELRLLDLNPENAYDKSRTSLHDFIENAIQEHLIWLGKYETSPANKDMITVNLTAKQLLLFMELNVDTEYIIDKSKQQALRILLNCIRTSHGGSLSYESVRKKEIDEQTVRKLHNYLITLLNKLKDKYHITP